MEFTFEVRGINLFVEVDNDAFTCVGIPSVLPSAMVVDPSKYNRTGFSGHVFVTEAFMRLPEIFRRIALTHEAGHVACGHLILPEVKMAAAESSAVTSAQLEAEADHWAAGVVGHGMYDAMLDMFGHESLRVLSAMGVVADFRSAKGAIVAETAARKTNYKSLTVVTP